MPLSEEEEKISPPHEPRQSCEGAEVASPTAGLLAEYKEKRKIMRRALLIFGVVLEAGAALTVCGVSIPNARPSPASRALDAMEWPESFPFTEADLTPEWAGNDGAFYTMPKFVQHAGDECRESLTEFYGAVLPPNGQGAVLDLCSSFTSHYPEGYKAKRCVALGLNFLELMANPSKTEYKVQDLNTNPKLPFDDDSFDVITNSLSVDYMTKPIELFAEMHRVLKPGGVACMAFTNRCVRESHSLPRAYLPSPSLNRLVKRPPSCSCRICTLESHSLAVSDQNRADLGSTVHGDASCADCRRVLQVLCRLGRDRRRRLLTGRLGGPARSDYRRDGTKGMRHAHPRPTRRHPIQGSSFIVDRGVRCIRPRAPLRVRQDLVERAGARAGGFGAAPRLSGLRNRSVPPSALASRLCGCLGRVCSRL